MSGKCFRSMKKSEPPHSLEVKVKSGATKTITAKCSCVAGMSGYCHHVIGLLFYLAHCKQLGLKSLPDDLTCTSMQQRWSIPRGRKIEQKEIQSVLVKKPQMGADYTKFIKSTLYSPSNMYGILSSAHFNDLNPKPLMASIAPTVQELPSVPMVISKFGHVPRGSVLSYQQKLSQEYVINDFLSVGYPELPLQSSGERFHNNIQLCLDSNKQAALESLSVTREVAIDIQEKTVTQSDNSLWYLLRKKRITASKFGVCAKRVGSFENLVVQLNPSRPVTTANMRRGIELEPRAAMVYANVAKGGLVNLYPSGLVINPKCPWLGCSPDRKVYDSEAANQGLNPFGLLEIKVVKEGETDFGNVRYVTTDPITKELTLKRNHEYYYQVQCQLGLTGIEWCDFFSYMNDTKFMCIRILFDQDFFQSSKDKVDNFFFNYFLNSP